MAWEPLPKPVEDLRVARLIREHDAVREIRFEAQGRSRS
jgi:hypothetical protein